MILKELLIEVSRRHGEAANRVSARKEFWKHDYAELLRMNKALWKRDEIDAEFYANVLEALARS